MDRLESLSNTLSQITMYDIKSMYNQAKNVVLNVSEMEAKVREATNDEPWGASSTLMQEIAQGTFNFQNFNEIMPCIYARFMEKEAKQWRQIYKALQLLEYLVKNGSERVVDDARSHIATIKMLRNFYYIDDKGKDQGLNVRNRSKELVELLSDVEKIRTERRKAKSNRNKYIGTGNDSISFSSGGGRYGGFGSDSLGNGGSSSSYGGNYSGERDFGDYSGGGSGGFRDSSSRRNYDEYEAGDDDTVTARRSNSLSTTTRGAGASPTPRRSATTPLSAASPVSAKAKAPEPAPNLLDLDDFSEPVAAPPPNANKALPVVATHTEDDEFDDFQTAPPSAGVVAPQVPALSGFARQAMSPPLVPQSPTVPQPPANLFNMLSSTATSPTMSVSRPPAYVTATMAPAMAPTMTPTANPMFSPLTPSVPASRTGSNTGTTVTTPAAAKPASSGGNFDDLWTMSLGSSATVKPPSGPTGPAKSIKDLEKEKAQAGIWGTGQQAKPPTMGAPFGSFGGAPSNAAAPPSSSGNALDDLLF